jgi:hydrogenase nickel incorporation protein HypB
MAPAAHGLDGDGGHGRARSPAQFEAGLQRVEVRENILASNDETASLNRADLETAGVKCINLMSSPGAGKTTLLRRTLSLLEGHCRIGIVEGDIETALDAEQLEGLGAPVSLVNTSRGFGGECHLDARMVRAGLEGLELDELDLVIIENVGNLVCPAEFDVGQHARAMVSSVTEGEEKPLKYPLMFRVCDTVVINKIDLLPHLEFDYGRFRANLEAVNPGASVIPLSARTGQGVGEWCAWLLGLSRPFSPVSQGAPFASRALRSR